MPFPNPDFRIFADGSPVEAPARLTLQSEERLGLLPWRSVLRFFNLPEDEELKLSRCRLLECRAGDALLCFGPCVEAFRRETSRGRLTTVVFSPGLSLWEARVSLSVPAGIPASETVRRILSASATGIPLLSFPGPDPAPSRGRAFFGRAAECLTEALRAAGARGCLTPSGLCAVPESGLPVSLVLGEEDLLSPPEFTRDGRVALRTREAGWTVGKTAEVRWQGLTLRGLMTEKSLFLDTEKEHSETELLLEVRT